MRVATSPAWLLLILIAGSQVAQTRARKITDDALKPETAKEVEETGFGFITSTLAPLSAFLFGSSDEEDKEEAKPPEVAAATENTEGDTSEAAVAKTEQNRSSPVVILVETKEEPAQVDPEQQPQQQEEAAGGPGEPQSAAASAAAADPTEQEEAHAPAEATVTSEDSARKADDAAHTDVDAAEAEEEDHDDDDDDYDDDDVDEEKEESDETAEGGEGKKKKNNKKKHHKRRHQHKGKKGKEKRKRKQGHHKKADRLDNETYKENTLLDHGDNKNDNVTAKRHKFPAGMAPAEKMMVLAGDDSADAFESIMADRLARQEELEEEKKKALLTPANVTHPANLSYDVMVSDVAFYPGTPDVNKLSNYLRTCDKCLVKWKDFKCPLGDIAMELRKWIRGIHELLTFGCQMGETCKDGSKCCHNRDPTLEQSMQEMSDMAKKVYDILQASCNNCPRDGGWTPWTPWSRCPVTCGGGTRYRTRTCTNPVPSPGAKKCPGLDRETEPCGRDDCCVPKHGNWSPWTTWQPCTVTCGPGGMQERQRTCSNPPPNRCGRTCPGPNSDMQPCRSTKPCCTPQDGNWGFWEPWSGCSSSCGSGIKTRTRRCANPPPNECGQNCPGVEKQALGCDSGPCCVPQNGNWGYWAPWSGCSSSCGPGTKTRTRQCTNPPPNQCGRTCPGVDKQALGCDGGQCCVPQNGNWGYWAPWSGCSSSCGPGTKTRTRQCTNPPPNQCGRTCPGVDKQALGCDGGQCCVPQNGNWGYWAPWSGCSSSCGPGTKTRTRQCTNPPPNQCGRTCPGVDKQALGCDGGQCCVPQNGNWGYWAPWSGCSSSCGPGTKSRTRQCTNPPPNECGQTCPGVPNQALGCDSGPCCNKQWSQWQSWGQCQASCGPGIRTRRRACQELQNYARPRYPPMTNTQCSPCPGRDMDTESCDAGPCAICANSWTQWQSWGPCQSSCGEGIRVRRRTCQDQQSYGRGMRPLTQCPPCPGRDMDSENCYSVPCVQPCGHWGQWSPCSVTCGIGTRFQTRTCPDVTARTRQRTRCRERQCCVDGNWGYWAPWSTCSSSCGPGVKSRTRSCNNPERNHCGKDCRGTRSETTACDGGNCCIPQNGNWGYWAPWSGCSSSCGSGTKSRTRQCNNPPPNECGRTCPGVPNQALGCDSGPCCVPQNGNWGFWAPWSGCSSSCGSGTKSRTRQCNSPPPNECGRTCPGVPNQALGCDSGPCCVPQDGNWGFWAPWSGCSSSCGSGTKSRTRQCNSPPPNECGRTCPGVPNQALGCDSGPCCVPQNGNWGYWSPWSGCSASCGPGSRTRQRSCSNPAPNSCGRTCPGSPTDQTTCHGGDCCVPQHGNWAYWTQWSRCSASCGPGTRTRSRQCSNPPPNECGRTCPGERTDMDRCDGGDCCVPQHGNWAYWTQWSRCSASCGPGTRTRSRQCSNPSPNECGRTCLGERTDTDRCDGGPCCVPQNGNWGYWSPWSGCSASCGPGSRTRKRSCSNPAPNSCGRTCPGSPTDQTTCHGGDCCVPQHGNWAYWTQWSRCSASCGPGTRTRSRQCTNPSPNECGRTCPGERTDMDRCDGGDCCVPQNGNWGYWAPWSGCSSSCGSGTKSRTRQCNSPPPNECGRTCPGVPNQALGCDSGPCCVPQHGNWAYWTQWSRCSASCGPGTRTRSRQCSNPSPNECGRTCLGERTDTDRCDGGPCCVPQNGNWGYWSPWSGCSASCGPGSRTRQRSCSNPAPNSCGRTCPGSPTDQTTCHGGDCCVPQDGNWAYWSQWSGCSSSCGIGTRTRSRQCTNPSPNECGRRCPGDPMDTDRCDSGPCCVPQHGNWAYWSQWSGCSSSCGSGTRTRSRQCTNPSPNECGRTCPGSPSDSDQCDSGPCCVNGNWGPWGPWSVPTTTCGSAMRERRRECDNPRPNFCGRTCPGSDIDSELYDTRTPCCVDGNWGNWGPWGACPVSCGMGVRERRRNCDSPSPDSCGRTCPGSGFATELQRCGPDPAEQQWNQWGPWTPCDVTCGTGRRTRERACPGQGSGFGFGFGFNQDSCSTPCRGEGSQVDVCQMPSCGPPPEWGEWESWCPCSCGNGRRSRRRSCESVDRYGGRTPSEISLCGPAPAREEMYCDVRLACPSCITDCTGKTDGDYPSCTSCNDYIRCRGGNVELLSCRASGYTYDAFIRKCTQPPSPSCTLVPCISSCEGLADGRYPSCFGCSSYVECRQGRDQVMECPPGQEFDAHDSDCSARKSPTCIRAIVRTIDFMQRDAPEDSYFRPDQYEKAESLKMYRALKQRAGVAAEFGRMMQADSPLERTEEEQQRLEEQEEAMRRKEDQETREKTERMTKEKPQGDAPVLDQIDEEQEELEKEKEKLDKKGEELAKEKVELVNEKLELDLWMKQQMEKIMGGQDQKQQQDEGEAAEEEEDDEEGDGEHEEVEAPQSTVVVEGTNAEADTEGTASEESKETPDFKCQKDCHQMEPGFYQSCVGCHVYLSCSESGIPRHYKCPKNKKWDDIKKKCRRHSRTCNKSEE